MRRSAPICAGHMQPCRASAAFNPSSQPCIHRLHGQAAVARPRRYVAGAVEPPPPHTVARCAAERGGASRSGAPSSLRPPFHAQGRAARGRSDDDEPRSRPRPRVVRRRQPLRAPRRRRSLAGWAHGGQRQGGAGGGGAALRGARCCGGGWGGAARERLLRVLPAGVAELAVQGAHLHRLHRQPRAPPAPAQRRAQARRAQHAAVRRVASRRAPQPRAALAATPPRALTLAGRGMAPQDAAERDGGGGVRLPQPDEGAAVRVGLAEALPLPRRARRRAQARPRQDPGRQGQGMTTPACRWTAGGREGC
eukprot:scaffold1258_cov272-Prasinococcus_capsulatus_cf.AAC.2